MQESLRRRFSNVLGLPPERQVPCKRCTRNVRLKTATSSVQQWCEICHVKLSVKRPRYSCKSCGFAACSSCGEGQPSSSEGSVDAPRGRSTSPTDVEAHGSFSSVGRNLSATLGAAADNLSMAKYSLGGRIPVAADCRRCAKVMKFKPPSSVSFQKWCDICHTKIQVSRGSYSCWTCNVAVCCKCGEAPVLRQQPLLPMGDNCPIDDDHMCVICFDAEADTILHPCGHDRFCRQCASRMDKCALCCQPVERSPCEEAQRILYEGMRVIAPDGRTKMHEATNDGDVRKVESYLSSGVSADILTSNGLTPLHFAATQNHVNVLLSLVAAKAALNLKDSSGSTPLHHAANGGHECVVQILLAEGADCNANDLQDMTPLHWAARMGHEKVVVTLLGAGADLNAKSCHGAGYTPLAMAEDWGTAAMTRLLREKGGFR